MGLYGNRIDPVLLANSAIYRGADVVGRFARYVGKWFPAETRLAASDSAARAAAARRE